MRVLVITSCTGMKAVTSPAALALEDFDDQRLLYFAKPGESRVTPESVVVPAGITKTRRYHEGLVGLKGKMMELIGTAVARDGRQVLQKIKADPTPITVLALLDREAGRA
jgi:hypothetical protein